MPLFSSSLSRWISFGLDVTTAVRLIRFSNDHRPRSSKVGHLADGLRRNCWMHIRAAAVGLFKSAEATISARRPSDHAACGHHASFQTVSTMLPRYFHLTVISD